MGHGRWGFALTLGGFAWSVALVAGAFIVPVYSGLSVSAGSSGEQVTHSYSSTLVEENGFGVLIPVAIPLVLAALVWFALHRRCARGSRWGGPIAWSLVAVLGLLGVVAMWTIGPFVLPVAVLLGIAASLTPLAPADAQ